VIAVDNYQGGQRQRIALARALVRNPAILILDEATSALDPVTEAGILTTIARIAKERTVIMITHRIAHALRADKIFVLENGSVVASGSHADLVEQGGVYTELWQQSHTRSSAIRYPCFPALRAFFLHTIEYFKQCCLWF
jgi:ATP-binding cassette subfamily B protein